MKPTDSGCCSYFFSGGYICVIFAISCSLSTHKILESYVSIKPQCADLSEGDFSSARIEPQDLIHQTEKASSVKGSSETCNDASALKRLSPIHTPVHGKPFLSPI